MSPTVQPVDLNLLAFLTLRVYVGFEGAEPSRLLQTLRCSASPAARKPEVQGSSEKDFGKRSVGHKKTMILVPSTSVAPPESQKVQGIS